jgi:hypothetical protein
MSSRKQAVYRIFFASQGKAYEIYARQVNQADLVGFVEVEGILFGERSRIVVDPGEESLRNEFGSVRRLLIPYHAVSRIEEVEREGTGKVLPLPSTASPGSGAPPPALHKP